MFFQWVGKFNSKVHFFMVSKNQIKLITSLQQKKFRQIHQLFIAEGVKVIQELLQSNFVLEHLYVTQNIFETISSDKKTQISDQDLKRPQFQRLSSFSRNRVKTGKFSRLINKPDPFIIDAEHGFHAPTSPER